MNRSFCAVLIATALNLLACSASAQQVNVGTPFHSAGHNFYEQIGVSWGLRGRGWFANFGGPAPAPAFGGFDPGAQANFGFGGRNGFLNFTAGQGSDRSLVSSTPSVTVMNGGTGFFSDTVQRPFVTGVIPVVGAGAAGPVLGPSVLEERLHRWQAEGAAAAASGEPPPALVFPPAASTAERGDASVAAIKARKSAEAAASAAVAQNEIDVLVEKARGAEADGKPAVAKLFWQMAARRASGEQRDEIVKQVQRLDAAR
ncbi:MAG: hypothetical protein SFU86_24210 [Pirellulaceae bacterium]|nr:hypothetical protein [Pirellulaceae bacterium]